MSLSSLKEELRNNNLKPIYLFHGSESYLRRLYKHRFKTVALKNAAEMDNMNYHYFEGNDATVSSVIDLAQTLPFLADRRVIIWENSGLFKDADERMLEFLKSVPESSLILFVENEVDKRGRMYKLLSKIGGAVEFLAQDEDSLIRGIGSALKKEGKQIRERDVRLFLGKTGPDMEVIHTELEKLICFCMQKNVIGAEDIEAIITTQVTNRIFDMVQAVADKRIAAALALYHDLLALKEPPMRILFLIARQYNNLMQVKELRDKGFDKNSIAQKVGLPAFVVSKHAEQATHFSMSELKAAVAACVACDEDIKSGRVGDRLGVELLVLKCNGL